MAKLDLDELKNCQQISGDAISKLSVGIRKNAMFWPKKSRRHLGDYLVTASKLPICVVGEPFKENLEAPAELGLLYQKDCPLGFDNYWEEIHSIRDSLQDDAAELVESAQKTGDTY